jgi:DNA-binding SARP family transcriptional activator
LEQPIGAPKLRQVLAVLCVRANHTVPSDDLIYELWHGRPPRSAATTLQCYLVRLRQKLASAARPASGPPDPKKLIRTEYAGYRLAISPTAIDFRRFEDMTAQGGRLLRGHDYVQAAQLLRSALQLWRGQAFADVPVGPILRTYLARFDDSRLTAAEWLVEAELRQGRHREVLDDLHELISRHPLNENLRAHLMIALYRCSRRPEALAAYQRFRVELAEELGVDPSLAMEKLHQAILRADPELSDPLRGSFALETSAA